MDWFVWITRLLVAFIVAVAVAATALALRRRRAVADDFDQEIHPEGFWIGTGISIGAGFGVALGLALQNLALGIAAGTTIGAGAGVAVEQRKKGSLRPLTEQEQKQRRWGVALGLAVLLIFLGALVTLLFT